MESRRSKTSRRNKKRTKIGAKETVPFAPLKNHFQKRLTNSCKFAIILNALGIKYKNMNII